MTTREADEVTVAADERHPGKVNVNVRHGNYVTGLNVSDGELLRIRGAIDAHLSSPPVDDVRECSNPACPLTFAHDGPCAPENWTPPADDVREALDLGDLEAKARAQIVAIDQMDEVGMGVGGMTRPNLAAHHVWQDATEGYDHADTVLALIERLRAVEVRLRGADSRDSLILDTDDEGEPTDLDGNPVRLRGTVTDAERYAAALRAIADGDGPEFVREFARDALIPPPNHAGRSALCRCGHASPDAVPLCLAPGCDCTNHARGACMSAENTTPTNHTNGSAK